MKHIRPHEIIHSKEFLREPVHDTFKEIESLPTSKIVLRGEGTGRSTLLYYMQEKKANTEQPFIRLNFDVAGLGIKENENEIFTKEFFQHLWEENFASNLLWYIKNYYEMTYHNDFAKYSDVINESSEKTYDFINKFAYVENYTLPKLFSTKEIVEEILDKFKKSMNIESIELGIDSFDHINNSDKLTQKILSTYFDLFDKTIITTSDDILPQEWYKTYFKDDSELYTFQPFSIEYGKNLEIIYNIIKKRIEEYNNSLYEENKKYNRNDKHVPLNWLDYDTLNLLITRTNGNIKLILKIINEIILEYNWSNLITNSNIEKAIRYKEKDEMERKLMFKPPKLHL